MDSSKFRSRLFTRSILRLPVFVTTARSVRYGDRKSTRLNSSHGYISYAVFCLKKKKKDHPHCRDARKHTFPRGRFSTTLSASLDRRCSRPASFAQSLPTLSIHMAPPVDDSLHC